MGIAECRGQRLQKPNEILEMGYLKVFNFLGMSVRIFCI